MDREVGKIIGIVFLIMVLVFIFSAIIYLSISHPERRLDVGADIETVEIEENLAYITLSGGANDKEIGEVKFVFTDNFGVKRYYLTTEGIDELSTPYNKSIFLAFKKPEFDGKYEYVINSSSIGLEDFNRIYKIEVVFEYPKEVLEVDREMPLDTEIINEDLAPTSGGGGGGPLSLVPDSDLFPLPDAYWEYNNNQAAQLTDFIYGSTLDLVLKDSGLSSGTTAEFTIYERDLLGDDYLTKFSRNVNSDGSTTVYWFVNESTVENAQNWFEGNRLELYFVVNGLTSDILKISFYEEEEISETNEKNETINEIIVNCSDGIQNQNEIGIDCGGECNACENNILDPEPEIHIISDIGLLSDPIDSPECIGTRTINVNSFSELQDALNNSQPGDNILVASGTYYLDQRIKTYQDGEENARICIIAENPANQPIFIRDSTYAADMLYIRNPYYIVDGLIFDGAELYPLGSTSPYADARYYDEIDGQQYTSLATMIYIAHSRFWDYFNEASTLGNDGSYFIMRNSEVKNNLRDCVSVYADYVTFENTEIHHCLRGGYYERDDAHCIVASHMQNLTIDHGDIHHCSGDAIQVSNDPGNYANLWLTWDNLIVKNTKMWTSPLEEDFGCVEEGFLYTDQIPGENFIDTKTFEDYSMLTHRPKLYFYNVEAFGLTSIADLDIENRPCPPADEVWVGRYIANRAAFNIKYRTDWFMDKIYVHDNEIAFRIRGELHNLDQGGATLSLSNSVIYNNKHDEFYVNRRTYEERSPGSTLATTPCEWTCDEQCYIKPPGWGSAFRVEREFENLHLYHNTFVNNDQMMSHRGDGYSYEIHPLPENGTGLSDSVREALYGDYSFEQNSFEAKNNLVLGDLPIEFIDSNLNVGGNLEVDSSSFVDSSSNNFSLVLDSLAINVGVLGLGITWDILGNLRDDGQPDIGAYEYKGQAIEPTPTGAIIADHNAADDFDNIPSCWIEATKDQFKIVYQHTSHGSQIPSGMAYLKDYVDPLLYAYSGSVVADSLFFKDGGMDGAGGYSAPDVGYDPWYQATRSYLDDPVNSDINVAMWSWCGQVNDHENDMDTYYLNRAETIKDDYGVEFIYMTGHLEPNEAVKNSNDLIRSHVQAVDGVLFDFADIEKWNPAGTEYPLETDACQWCSTWCGSSEDCTDILAGIGSCAHSNDYNCYRKARAFWWMMARLAGWDGVSQNCA